MISLIVKDQDVQRTFRRLIENSQNPEPANAGMAARMVGAVEDNFRAEGRPSKWTALRPSTIASRAAAGKSGKILQRSGHLARSITPFHTRTVAGVGTNVPYAAAMNNGSKAHVIQAKKKKALAFNGRFYKRVKHPGTVPRQFMVLTDQDKGDLLQIMAMHLASGA